jgi:hypothetical protein
MQVQPYPRFGFRSMLVPVLLLLMSGGAAAQEIDLTWDPVNDTDLAGYRIFYDTQEGSGYRNFVDVGLTTTWSLGSQDELSYCTYYYVAVKARDLAGQLSDAYSNQVVGYPHPVVTSMAPNTLNPGEVGTVVVQGNGFAQDANPTFGDAGVEIVEGTISIDHCGQMTFQVQVDAEAQEGSRSFEVVNTDGSYIYIPQAFNVGGFAVVGVTPGASTNNVDPTTEVQVQFSHPLESNRVNGVRFKTLRMGPPGRSTGKARMAAGYPRLEGDGMTVTLKPKTSFEAGQRYAVFVKGGKKGVRDTEGNTLPTHFQQGPGFTTADLIETITYGPSAAAATTPLEPGAEVPVDSVFVVHFSEPVRLSSSNKVVFKIRRPGKGKLQLAGSGHPVRSTDGYRVILEPADVMPSGQNLELQIKGRTKGVKSERGVTMALAKVTVSFTTQVGSPATLGVAE